MFCEFTLVVKQPVRFTKLLFWHAGVEFGARMINIDGKQIKLQIWDTVSSIVTCSFC